MITIDELKAAIAECQGERNPNANTCIKLAAYYTILNELEDRAQAYSYTSAPVIPVNETVGYYSETDFGQAVEGKDTSFILGLIDELMTVLQAVQPQLYNGVMRQLNK